MSQNKIEIKVETCESVLLAHGYKVCERDPKIKSDFPGALMVVDPEDDEDGYAIVGDDRAELILEAHDHLFVSDSLPEWNGSPSQEAPGTWWVDDETGEYVSAKTGERMSAGAAREIIRTEFSVDQLSYKDLARLISEMPAERQDDTATIFVSGVGESYSVLRFGSVDAVDHQGDLDGVVDDGQYVVVI